MNPILVFDTWLFLLLNTGVPRHPLLDLLFIILSGVESYGLIWLLAGGWLFLREERRYHVFFLPLGVAVSGSYALVEWFIKPLIARPRPVIGTGAVIIADELSTYSFPSSHATVAFAGAMILSHFEPRHRKLWFFLAAAIAYSRIYLGKHYPLDVTVGAVLGLCIGFLSLGIYAQVRRAYPKWYGDKQKWQGEDR